MLCLNYVFYVHLSDVSINEPHTFILSSLEPQVILIKENILKKGKPIILILFSRKKRKILKEK